MARELKVFGKRGRPPKEAESPQAKEEETPNQNEDQIRVVFSDQFVINNLEVINNRLDYIIEALKQICEESDIKLNDINEPKPR